MGIVVGMRLRASLRVRVLPPGRPAPDALPTLLGAKTGTCSVIKAAIVSSSCPDLSENPGIHEQNCLGKSLEQAVTDIETLCRSRLQRAESWQRIMSWSAHGTVTSNEQIHWVSWERFVDDCSPMSPKAIGKQANDLHLVAGRGGRFHSLKGSTGSLGEFTKFLPSRRSRKRASKSPAATSSSV